MTKPTRARPTRPEARRPHLAIAAGGTGGHVFPALSVAAVARARGVDVTVVGGAQGPEATWCAEADVPFVGVPTGKWDRQRPDPREFVRALAGPVAAVRWMRRARPVALLGMGGFASFPGCAAAVLTSTPLILHEGNAFPGRVTRWFAGRADGVASPYDEALGRLPTRPTGPVMRRIGLPVRETHVERDEARRLLGLPPSGTVTLVMGGSQGSLALNELVPQVAKRLGPSRGTVLHAAGRPWVSRVREATSDVDDYVVTDFVDAALAWSAADLAIVRGGTSTLSEAAFHGVPVIVVPLPSSAEDHQRANAASVQVAGAGHHVEQDDPAGLDHAWRALLRDDHRIASAAAMTKRSPAGAAAELLDFVWQLSRATASAGGGRP